MRASDLHVSSLAKLPPKTLAEALASLTEAEAEELLHDWRFVAREEQVAPEGDWQVWAYIAGRGAGKTRAGAEWVREKVMAGCSRIALVAPTAADARDVMVEGDSGILSVCWAGDRDHRGRMVGRPMYEPSKRRLTWANGAIATTYSADEPDRLRGPQHGAAWLDEVAAWNRAQEAYDMLMFGLRLGANPQAMVTTTPRPIPLVRQIVTAPTTVVTRGSTYANRANLAASYLEKIVSRYEGTRLGRQELLGEILDDVPGALWSRDMIDAAKAKAEVPDMQRVVVAVDPSGTSGEDDGDSVGIVVAGKGVDGRAYVLADRTCKLSPAAWARRVVQAAEEFGADRIVAERNYGGAMVEAVIRTAGANVPYKEVTASRGKVVRAEPIAALYEQGRVSHVPGLTELEDQMCAMTSADGYVGEGSPDRVDALVWALTELMVSGSTYSLANV